MTAAPAKAPSAGCRLSAIPAVALPTVWFVAGAGGAETYRTVSQLHGSVSDPSADGWVSYGPAQGYAGSDSFTFRANDGLTNSPAATVSVTVRSRDWLRLDIQRQPDGRVRMQFPTETDTEWRYWVEWCASLLGDPLWTPVSNAAGGDGTPQAVVDEDAATNAAPQRFYRLGVTIP